jgi:hypothetical protein
MFDIQPTQRQYQQNLIFSTELFYILFDAQENRLESSVAFIEIKFLFDQPSDSRDQQH